MELANGEKRNREKELQLRGKDKSKDPNKEKKVWETLKEEGEEQRKLKDQKKRIRMESFRTRCSFFVGEMYVAHQRGGEIRAAMWVTPSTSCRSATKNFG